MKNQTYSPTRIPSSKPLSQKGKKDTRNLLAQILVAILVLTFAFAAYLTARNLPWESFLSRLAGNTRSFPMVYDATAARNAAIVLPAQVIQLDVKSSYYDATGAMNAAIALPSSVELRAAKSFYYDATGTMLAAISPKVATSNRTFPYAYDATATMLAAINPKVTAPSRTFPYTYDATETMLNAIVNP